MSNLTDPLQSLIDQATELKDSGTVKQFAKRLNPKKVGCQSLLLLDVSGSMHEFVGPGVRKIDLLRQALDRPLAPGEVAIAFQSVVLPINSLQAIPEPMGGTALHLAIAEGANRKPAATLIVSDGKPDDAKQALRAAGKLSGVINTLYIGSDDDYEAIEFMRSLARLGCGKAQVCDVSKPEQQPQLKHAIAGLLPG